VTGLVVPKTFPFRGSVLGDVLPIALLPFPVIASACAYLEARRKLDGEERRRLDAEWGRLGS
jgi:hypothetical protein